MKLLNINVTPFLQIIWLSQKSRENWESAINKCASAVQEMEIESVVMDHRECAWRTIKKETLPTFSAEMMEKGLTVLPVRFVGDWGNSFIHYTPPGDAQVYCIIAKKHESALRYLKYFQAGDNKGQGEMLGFPSCCRQSFDRNWKLGDFDPIVAIWKNTEGKAPHPYSNPILRYIGVRIGFHIPCSFSCKETIDLAATRLSIAKPDVTKLLSALLSMPMRWDGYRGIAIVKTPIFYIVTTTTPYDERVIIDLKGSFIPRDGLWHG